MKNYSLNSYTKNSLLLLCAFSKLLTNDRDNTLQALVLFESLIDEDVSNTLHYSHFMGAIGCTTVLRECTKTKYYFDKLLVNNSIKDLGDHPSDIVSVDLESIYNLIFGELSKAFSNDKERKEKCNSLKSLYLYNKYDTCGEVRFTKRHINDLKRYYKKNADNVEIDFYIYNMEIAMKLYFSAYLTFMDMLNHYFNPIERYINANDAIENCTDEEFDKIYTDACQKIDTDFQMDMNLFVTEIVDPIIDRLWGVDDLNRSYQKIISIPEKLNISILEGSNNLFELAYSYAEFNNPKSKILYEMILKKEPRSSNTLNNLGVIYKNEGDLFKAKECFNTAHEINSKEELYLNNLKGVKIELEKYALAFEKVKNENIWFIERLNMFYGAANISDIVECTYKERPNLLKVAPQKASELIDRMVEKNYIEKVKNGNYNVPTSYKTNPLIKSYLKECRLRIENNKEYEKITDKLNIETLEEIGYTSELTDLINNIPGMDFRELLKRDIKECAICLLIEQNKAAIIMCGSVIEALLMNKILENKIDKYDIGILSNKANKIKKTIDMDLNELLFIIDKENLIKKEHFHLSHFARSYRNIIHPACEIRKGFEISNEEAKFMWDVLLRIIRAIL